MELDLDDLPLIEMEDVVFFRVAEYDTPFWPTENTQPGRWNAPGDGATQYWSQEPDGAWAEILRAHEIRSTTEVAELRMRIWASRITCSQVVDLSSFSTATQAGIDASLLVSDDHRGCHELGQWFRANGVRGVLAPSAALPGSTNLTLFGPRHRIGWSSQLKLASSSPAGVVAVGHPAEDVLADVRHVGTEHAGLVRFQVTGQELPRSTRWFDADGLDIGEGA